MWKIWRGVNVVHYKKKTGSKRNCPLNVSTGNIKLLKNMHKGCDFKETKSSINRLFIFWWNTKEKEKNLKRGGRLLTMNNKTFYFTVGLMYSHWSYLDETHMKKKSQTSDNEQRTFYFKLGRCIIKALTVTRTFLKALFWMLALIFYNGKKKHCTFFIYHNIK